MRRRRLITSGATYRVKAFHGAIFGWEAQETGPSTADATATEAGAYLELAGVPS